MTILQIHLQVHIQVKGGNYAPARRSNYNKSWPNCEKSDEYIDILKKCIKVMIEKIYNRVNLTKPNLASSFLKHRNCYLNWNFLLIRH